MQTLLQHTNNYNCLWNSPEQKIRSWPLSCNTSYFYNPVQTLKKVWKNWKTVFSQILSWIMQNFMPARQLIQHWRSLCDVAFYAPISGYVSQSQSAVCMSHNSLLNTFPCLFIFFHRLPPEAIVSNVFTLWSDVWSYGITLWEMFSFGQQPWAELSLNQVQS